MEVAAILENIVGTPLKKCDGFASIIDGYSCDFNWTNRNDIGIVVAAFEKDGWIHVSAEVRDSTAVSKITDKVWARKWSVFVAHASETNSGMLEGVFPLSVTLVTNPAYPAAGFEVQAGAHPKKPILRRAGAGRPGISWKNTAPTFSISRCAATHQQPTAGTCRDTTGGW